MEELRDYKNAIEVSDLSVSYDGFALKNVAFKVPKGSVMGFIGQNGAGKTTTIRSILNMISTKSGDISILGYDNKTEEEYAKQDIGVVFDEMGFHKTLNPVQLNKMFRYIYKNWNEEIFFGYLDRFGLPRKKKTGKFSRGMQVKLQIAVALSHNARLLIMDEPTSGLDPIIRNEILDVFLEFVENEEHSILLSSHIISDLERIADYITFIDKGHILISDEKLNILETHGIIKCRKEDIDRIDNKYIVGKRMSQFGGEVMVSDKEKCRVLYSDLLIEDAGLEEVMLFYVLAGGDKQ